VDQRQTRQLLMQMTALLVLVALVFGVLVYAQVIEWQARRSMAERAKQMRSMWGPGAGGAGAPPQGQSGSR